MARSFRAFAKGTREDFHEPGEQGIRLRKIEGDELDNAFGDATGRGEAVIIFERNGKLYRFNLADLCALAKVEAAK